MGKRGLNIYHRKDGRWEGRYRCGFTSEGKPKYHSIYAKSYSDVKEKLLKIQAQTHEPESKTMCTLTVQDISVEWLKARRLRLKESTCANYEFKITKHILPMFGKLKLNELSPTLVTDFMQNKLSEGLSGKYVSDIVVILKSIMKYAAKIHHCFNPIEDVELPKREKHEMKLYSVEELTTLKTELYKNTNLTKLGVLICLFTGIRIGELCALRWSDIDLKNLTLHITKTCQRVRQNGGAATKLTITAPKSASSIRIIPLPKALADILREFEPSDKGAYLLSGSDTVIEPRTMQYRFQALLKKANLPSINFHSLRHMFATSCIELGFDVKTLSEILGHGTVEITLNRYVHSSMDRKRECMDKLQLLVA